MSKNINSNEEKHTFRSFLDSFQCFEMVLLKTVKNKIKDDKER